MKNDLRSSNVILQINISKYPEGKGSYMKLNKIITKSLLTLSLVFSTSITTFADQESSDSLKKMQENRDLQSMKVEYQSPWVLLDGDLLSLVNTVGGLDQLNGLIKAPRGIKETKAFQETINEYQAILEKKGLLKKKFDESMQKEFNSLLAKKLGVKNLSQDAQSLELWTAQCQLKGADLNSMKDWAVQKYGSLAKEFIDSYDGAKVHLALNVQSGNYGMFIQKDKKVFVQEYSEMKSKVDKEDSSLRVGSVSSYEGFPLWINQQVEKGTCPKYFSLSQFQEWNNLKEKVASK